MFHNRMWILAVFAVSFLTIREASAQNLSLVSGDGQVAVQNNLANYPLVVLAKDASGRPQQGVAVNWSVSGPGNLPTGSRTVTGADGTTSNQFVGATIYGDTAFTQSTITASTASSSVTMHATTSGTDLTSGSIFVQAEILLPTLADVLTDTGAAPVVQVHVFAVHQAGVQQVPNVIVRLIPDNPNGPLLACAAGTGFTDANGMANCQVVFSGPTGSGSFSIEVGGFRTFSPFQFSATHHTGQAATIVITGGNNQSGAPGAQLPAPLTARVQDAAGNPLPNTPVVWQPTNPQAVSLSSVVSTSDANGMVSAIARLGSALGSAQVQLSAANGAAQVTFNLTVTQSQPPPVGGHGTPASILITSGNNQSGPPGATLATLTAKILDAAGNPVSGAPVTWQAVNAQAVSLGNVVSTSDGNGIVSAVATLGSTLGATQVQLQTTGGGTLTPFGVAGGALIQTVFNLTVVQAGTGRGGMPASFRITGGNNQSGPPGARLPAQLTAQVLDGASNPLPNVPVVWQAVNPQSASLSAVVSTSDANGMVSAIATLGSTLGPVQVQVQTTNNVAQTPFGTVIAPVQATFSLTVTVAQTQPATLLILSGNNQSGLAGAQLPAPLVARIVDTAGNPVPNVAVVWQPLSAVSLSSVVSTSDGNGLVSTVVTLGSTAGPAQVQLRTSTGAIQTTFNLTVNQPQPANLHIISGNNQSGPAGSQLPAPLIVRVEDASGNPVPNIAVIWQPVNQSVSLSSVVATSDANGLVSAIGTLGFSAVPVQVQLKVSNAPVQATFTLQATLTLTGLAIAGGNSQQAAPGSNFAQPLIAQLFATGGPAAGFQVQFTSAGAPVFISNGGVAVSDSSGRATVSVQAGTTSGTAVVTATSGNFSASLTLTIQAGTPAPLSFFNGANNQPGVVSPAGIVAIYGTGIVPGVSGCVAANQVLGPLPMSLSGLTVQFASSGYTASAPFYSVCNSGPGQEYVVVQTPADLPLVDTTVTVQAGGSPLGQGVTPTAPASPGIFTTQMSDGTKRAILRRQDGTYVSLEAPAQAGERLQAFVTGLGRPVTASGIALNTNQAGISGDDAPPPNPVTIGVAGEVLQPVTATYATDQIGVYVLTFDVPNDAPSGTDAAFTVTTTLADQSVLTDSTTLPIQ
jgi:adhesin/invasin